MVLKLINIENKLEWEKYTDLKLENIIKEYLEFNNNYKITNNGKIEELNIKLNIKIECLNDITHFIVDDNNKTIICLCNIKNNEIKNKSNYICTIKNVIFNFKDMHKDILNILYSFLELFQDWSSLYICMKYLYNQDIIKYFFELNNGITNSMNEYYIIQLYKTQGFNFKNNIKIQVYGNEEHNTKGCIIFHEKMIEFKNEYSMFENKTPQKKERNMRSDCVYYFLIFENPLLCYKNDVNSIYDLSIAGEKYKSCGCNLNPKNIKFCEETHKFRQMSKLRKYEIINNDNLSDLYSLIYGIRLESNIDDDNNEYIYYSVKQKYYNISNVYDYEFSRYLKQFTNYKNTEVKSFYNLLELVKINKDIIEYKEETDETSYIYLIQEREYYERKEKKIYINLVEQHKNRIML